MLKEAHDDLELLMMINFISFNLELVFSICQSCFKTSFGWKTITLLCTLFIWIIDWLIIHFH